MQYHVWVYALVSVLIVSVISLIGVFFLSLDRSRLQKMLLFLVSFAVGGLVGDALIHLIPESFERLTPDLLTSMLILLGILGFFVVEKFIRWRHCHIPTSSDHLHPVVTLNLVGDGVHNLIDGMLVAASYAVAIPIGIATTIAVLLHEIPQEIGDFAILLHGGLSVRKALLFNFASATMAILGALIVLVVGQVVESISLFMLPITAGGFIYIAGSDLMPELHHECGLSMSLRQFLFITLGIGLMALLLLLE